MSDEHYIAPIFIEKLGHKLPEVRERALSAIILKLDCGFTFENELASYRELLAKLYNWFLLEPCTNEENVINLIQRILQLPIGKVLLGHSKHAMQLELHKLKSCMHPKFYQKLAEIIDTEIQSEASRTNVVPPLSSELLSLSTASSSQGSTSDVQSSAVSAITTGLVRKGPCFYIEPTFIQDLEHKSPEIRERALFSLVSRIDCGFTFENELPCYRELLTNLFNWFIADPRKNEDYVIGLIKHILQSQSGKILITSHMHAMQQYIDGIKSYLDPRIYEKLNDTLNTEISKINLLPPEVPSSHIRDPTSNSDDQSSSGDSSATSTRTKVGTVSQTGSIIQPYSIPKSISQTWRPESSKSEGTCSTDLKYILDWQPLIHTDKIVLQSVEDSLNDPQDPYALIRSCDFFINVLVHDFPAEVFLQRPGIVTRLYELLSTRHSSRLLNVILQCLFELTKALDLRIHQYSDQTLQNSKTELLFHLGLYEPTGGKTDDAICENFELAAETKILKKKQFTVPEYCFRTINVILKIMALKQESIGEHKPKLNQIGFDYCLTILDELLTLLYQTVSGDIWDETENLEIFKEINKSLSLLGDTVEYFNLESISVKYSLTCRVVYLFLTCISAKWLLHLIPLSKTMLILPKNFKICLSDRLLDVSLGRLYPNVHECLLEYVQSFSSGPDINCLKKYEDVMKVCNSLTSSIKLFKDSGRLTTQEKFKLAYEALPSLEFHQNMNFIASYIDLCSKELFDYLGNQELVKMANETILSLLAHRLPDVQQETYRWCHIIVTRNIGAKIKLPSRGIYGSQIIFLLNSAVLTEIAVFGLNNGEVEKYAEDIILYILKCKMIVSDIIWNKCMEALIPSLPMIICYATNSTLLGRTIVHFVDPDSVRSLGIPLVVMLKGNVELLFCKDSTLRNEGYARICWLISTQENARQMLPRLNTVYNATLANACNIEKIMDVNKVKKSVHFYQPSSLYQVIDVLRSENVESTIRRSALNQISVMIDDYLLHEVFLNLGGIDLMIEIMEIALKANDFRDIPDTVIPVVAVLRTMALYHSSVREYIALKSNVIYHILRGAFLFVNDDRMRQDATVLLFLLIFKNYIIGSPIRGDFSIPKMLEDRLLVPFFSNRYMSHSLHKMEDFYSRIVNDRYSLISLQVQWNADIHGGFDNLMKLNESAPVAAPNIQSNGILTLKHTDLMHLQTSSLDFCIKKYLFTIQSATSHEGVLDSITKLTLYLHLCNTLTQLGEDKCDEIIKHPWKKSFIRYLDFLPSGDEDIRILGALIKFLIVLVPFYNDSEVCWISQFLENPKTPLLNILAVEDTSDESIKMLSQDLLKLITLCVVREHNFLNSRASNIVLTSNWGHMIRIISKYLESDGNKHFYSLAYLDALLSCLVNLTAKLGWSQCKPGIPPKQPIPQLILSLCELITAFHRTKGAANTVSFMGLSISRNVLLILNHLLAEMMHFKVKKWERCFFGSDETRTARRSFFSMWSSRDVILRAAALQLFASLTSSITATYEILYDFEHSNNANIWEYAMRIVTDYREAGIVKENAALLLANLSNYFVVKSHSGSMPSIFLSPFYESRRHKGHIELSHFLEANEFYNHVEIVLTPIYAADYMPGNPQNRDQGSLGSFVSSNEEPQEIPLNLQTPGFITAFCKFLYNVIDLGPKEVCHGLQERGLVRLIFRLICIPIITVDNKKELAFYCSLLEMNTAICALLKKICILNGESLLTLLHTRDCLDAIFRMLNSKYYYTHLSLLVYLRNNLWSEIFNLITALLDGFNKQTFTSKTVDSLTIISETITENGTGVFLETLCESLGSIGTNDLQNSSLATLVALLRIECTVALNKNENRITKVQSIENVLDTVRSHKTILIPSFKEKVELKKDSKLFNSNPNDYKNNLLEEAYFGKITRQLRSTQLEDEVEISIVDSSDDNALMAGAEFCKILLYLFDIVNIKLALDNMVTKKSLVNAALTGLLCISQEAKKIALQNGLMESIVKDLRDYHIQLSLRSVDSLRKVQAKKKICPMLQEISYLIGLLTNFMLNAGDVKELAASLDLADVTHKLWVWFSYQNSIMVNVLKMISVYTFECPQACRTLPFTNPTAGSGPRRTFSTVSLLHAIIALILKEMDQISQSHDLLILELAFDILNHCCDLLECRVGISKSNLFQTIMKLNPVVTRRQRPWDKVELLWIEFLKSYTKYPEGQTAVVKNNDILELVMALAKTSKVINRQEALLVLRNVSFYHPNRTKLLSSGDFLNILQTKLTNGTCEEKRTILTIIWTLAANCQKAKITFKSAHLDVKLENTIKCTELVQSSSKAMEKEDLDTMYIVLNVLRGQYKTKKTK